MNNDKFYLKSIESVEKRQSERNEKLFLLGSREDLPRIKIIFRGQIVKFIGSTKNNETVSCFYDPASKYPEVHFKAFYNKLIA